MELKEETGCGAEFENIASVEHIIVLQKVSVTIAEQWKELECVFLFCFL